jgi:hypothetical protein
VGSRQWAVGSRHIIISEAVKQNQECNCKILLKVGNSIAPKHPGNTVNPREVIMRSRHIYPINRLFNLKAFGAFGLLVCILGFGVYVIGSSIVESAHAQNGKIKAKIVQRNAPKKDAGAFKVFDVDCEYGTLSFKGRVERTDIGDQYKYRVQIAVVFLPAEFTPDGYTMTNRTKVADLKFCDLVATEFVEEGKPYKLLARDYRPIALRLTESGEVGTLPDLEFLMPKSAVDVASHVGLGVSGSGNIYWPIPVELK